MLFSLSLFILPNRELFVLFSLTMQTENLSGSAGIFPFCTHTSIANLVFVTEPGKERERKEKP